MIPTKYNDIMMDLETLSTAVDCAIVSIGAVRFNADTIADDKFYRIISIESNLAQGRVVSADTLRWWLEQDAQAKAVFNDPNQMHISAALSDFQKWIGADAETVNVWSNGADFDIAIMANAYAKSGTPTPWKFYNTRCFRTIKSTPATTAVPKPKNFGKHNALLDAINQAQHLQLIWKAAVPVQPVAEPGNPSAEDYSDMLRAFFFHHAAGGYNDAGRLVPLETAKDKLEWIVNEAIQHAAPAAQGDAKDEKLKLDAACRSLEHYADSYERMGRIGNDGKVECASVAHDIRRNMVDAVRAAFAVSKAGA